jgi:hypothetical protein
MNDRQFVERKRPWLKYHFSGFLQSLDPLLVQNDTNTAHWCYWCWCLLWFFLFFAEFPTPLLPPPEKNQSQVN